MLYHYWQQIDWAWPWVLTALLLLPLLALLQKQKKLPSVHVPVSTTADRRQTPSLRHTLRHLPFGLRLGAIGFLLIALAQPRLKFAEQKAEGKGIDILLCIDVSGSMLAEDFLPNRMEAAKEVAARFVEGRLTDRIGVVIFAGEPFTLCPLTTDHAVVLQQLYGIRSGSLQDGTAIGSGLATSVERLRSSDAVSRVVVLLTDGENNGGIIPPSIAKELAKLYGIKVYTIGIGTEGYAIMPQQTREGVVRSREKVNIDEALLQQIASETGGRYFRARDKRALQTIYSEINQLEKTTVQRISYNRYTQLFYIPALVALLLIFAELWLRYRYLKSFP